MKRRLDWNSGKPVRMEVSILIKSVYSVRLFVIGRTAFMGCVGGWGGGFMGLEELLFR